MIYLLFALCTATLGMQTSHFQTTTHVTPVESSEESDAKEYFVEIEIEKVDDQKGTSETLAAPKMLCTEGYPSQFVMESEDGADQITIDVVIPQDGEQKRVETSIVIKENDEIVLDDKAVLEMNNG